MKTYTRMFLVLIVGMACYSQRFAFAEEPLYDRAFATYEEREEAVMQLSSTPVGEILANLRKLELIDPAKLNREYAADIVESNFRGEKGPEVMTFLFDWIEFRRQFGPGKNVASGEDELYPAFMALKRRGLEVIPDLLQHATAGPRSISYRHRVRLLIYTLIPNEKKRKKTLVEFTDAHPELEEAMKIFDPLPQIPYDERSRIMDLPLNNPERVKYFEERHGEKLYISVGQWKRMTEEAAQKAQPVEKSPDAKR